MDPTACVDVLAAFAHYSYKHRLFLLSLLIHSSPLQCHNSPLRPEVCLFAKKTPTQTHFCLVQCYNCCLLPALKKKKKKKKPKPKTTTPFSDTQGWQLVRQKFTTSAEPAAVHLLCQKLISQSRSTCLPSSQQPQCKVKFQLELGRRLFSVMGSSFH